MHDSYFATPPVQSAVDRHEAAGLNGRSDVTKGKGKGKGKVNAKPQSANQPPESKYLWDYVSSSYVEYSPVSQPMTSDSEASTGIWRRNMRNRRTARATEEVKPTGASSPPSEAGSDVSDMKQDLAALLRAKASIANDTSERATALRSSLLVETKVLRQNISAAKPLNVQIKLLEGLLERKNIALTKAHSTFLEAKINAEEIKKELSGITDQLTSAKKLFAAQQMEETKAAAAKAAETARVALENSLNIQITSPVHIAPLPCSPLGTPSASIQLPLLTANHLMFIQQMAVQFLPPDQAQSIGMCFSNLSPYLQAAGITPVPLAPTSGTPGNYGPAKARGMDGSSTVVGISTDPYTAPSPMQVAPSTSHRVDNGTANTFDAGSPDLFPALGCAPSPPMVTLEVVHHLGTIWLGIQYP